MILKNCFHNTTVRINLYGKSVMSRGQVHRAWKALCGKPNCHCCGVAGICPTSQPQPDGTVVTLWLLVDGKADVFWEKGEDEHYGPS